LADFANHVLNPL